MEFISIKNLSFTYPESSFPALSSINIGIEAGDFVLLAGASGCGKSTLLQLLKPQISPKGQLSGEIYIDGTELSSMTQRQQAEQIGCVMQNPDAQLVTDKVWHELAFGLESLGLERSDIRRRVAEMTGFFGLEDIFHKDTASLSGGQKQLLNLASVMAMEPALLLLDEPTSQLDPMASSSLLLQLTRINRQLGTTIILADHNLEATMELCNKVLLLDKGKGLYFGSPQSLLPKMKTLGLWDYAPTPCKVWSAVNSSLPCPVNLSSGRSWLKGEAEINPPMALEPLPELPDSPVAIRYDTVYYRYSKNGCDVLKGLNLTLHQGELLALLGGNGVGKSTALSLAAGEIKPLSGKITVNGKAAILPQEPRLLFSKDTLSKELYSKSNHPEDVITLCHLDNILDRHPYDLSGGEIQRAGLALVLLEDPDILLLDEPTKGLDKSFCRELGAILKALTQKGMAILLVSHDTDFCAAYADNCCLLFDGCITAKGDVRSFFSGGSFYTTTASKMAGDTVPHAITPENIIHALGGSTPNPPPPQPPKAERFTPSVPANTQRRKINFLTLFILALLIPATIFAGIKFFGDRKYYIISAIIMAEVFLAFFSSFEASRPSASHLALLAVLSALAVAGRAALIMVPTFKPVLAVVIISAVALGPESGFLVGAVSMLASNILFGQGPWTPWQMLAMGTAGYCSGLIFPTLLSEKRVTLCIYGALAALVIYGGIMNPASVIMYQSQPTASMFLAAYLSGLPMDLVHAGATALLLGLFGTPMLKRLNRICQKYNIS